jgi:hypothetical protein
MQARLQINRFPMLLAVILVAPRRQSPGGDLGAFKGWTSTVAPWVKRHRQPSVSTQVGA